MLAVGIERKNSGIRFFFTKNICYGRYLRLQLCNRNGYRSNAVLQIRMYVEANFKIFFPYLISTPTPHTPPYKEKKNGKKKKKKL